MRKPTLSLSLHRMRQPCSREKHEGTMSIDMQQPRGASFANVLVWLLLHEERKGNVF
jgi:hypothetical protein